MKKITLIVLMLFTALSYAQVGINIATPHASSALDITSTTGGLLVPRMTEVQRDDINSSSNPAIGLMIYQTDGASGFYFWNGSAWTKIDGVAGPQGTDGNDGLQGETGVAGPPGQQGIQGLEGAQGEAGSQGIQGLQGETGVAGPQGETGAGGDDGSSAYEMWVAAGNTGTEVDFLASLVGADGNDGANGADGTDGNGIASTTDNNDGTFTLTYTDGSTFTTSDLTGPQGTQGEPASEVDQGYVEGVYCSKPGATAYSNDTGQDVVCTPYLTINGSEQYLITNELVCPDNSEGTTTNIEYWISFEVSQPLMAYLLHFAPYANNSFCGNDNGDYKQIFKSNSSTFNSSSNLGDLIYTGSTGVPKLIFSPGFTYTIRLAGLDSNTRTTSVSNYVVNESLFNNVKFYSSSPDSLVLNEATDQWALLVNFGPSWVNGNILTVFTEWELRWENN